MDPGRWQQIEELYHAALSKEAADRASFLDQACAGNALLRDEVESLLAFAADADGYLKAAVRDATLPPSRPKAEALTQGERSAEPQLPPPQTLGRYQILEEVGKGGMGVVYRAVDPAIGRTVAIKTILLDGIDNEQRNELRERLLRESQAGGRLSHPNIVAIHDVNEEGNRAYIVMEFITGRTLEKIMADDQGRSLPEALRILHDCAIALDYAHSRGVVHRDIKPANIMLQADGVVKIADFGIARAEHFSALTKSAVIVGSPQYMAPEQWRGEAVTGRADQYCLALVAFSLLTGRRAFESETVAAMAARTLYEDPPVATSFNPALPQAVNNVFRKALAKSADARYETCSQFADELSAACGRSPSNSSANTAAGARPKQRKWLAPVIGAAVLAVAAGAVWFHQRNTAAQIETTYWASIKDSHSTAPFDEYLKRYPAGHFVKPAKAELAALNTQSATESKPVFPVTPQKTPARVTLPKTPAKSQRDSQQRKLPKTRLPSANDSYHQGDDLLKRGAYAEAVSYFSDAIAAEPEYRSYFGRANAYQRLEQLKPAIEDYSQAIRLNPAIAMPYHERAVCRARLNQDDDALTDYNHALTLARGYGLSWNGRGVIYLRRKEYQKAISDFTEAIRLLPTYDQPYKNRATAKKALGDAAGAEADLNRARALKQ